MAALKLKKVGYAVAIDLGDPTSPQGSIHPRRKQEVGRRLSLSCLNIQYGMGNLWTGPLVKGVGQVNATTVEVEFFGGESSEGLHSSGTGACKACCNESPFMVQVAQGIMVRASKFSCDANKFTCLVTLPSKFYIDADSMLAYDWEGYP